MKKNIYIQLNSGINSVISDSVEDIRADHSPQTKVLNWKIRTSMRDTTGKA